MFYDRFITLCNYKGVSPSRAAVEAGLSKSTVTNWKNDPSAQPTGNVLGKLSRYFGVTVSELLDETAVLPDPLPMPKHLVLTPAEPEVFYDRFTALCRRRGVSPSRAAIDAGLSKSTVTKWKNEPGSHPTGIVIDKLVRYFGITVSELMGEGPNAEESRPVTEDDIKFALFGGSEDITPEMYEEVRNFAAFVKQREAAKRGKD